MTEKFQREETLTIYLLSHNRLKMVTGAIHSINSQTNKNFNFVVSDNSTEKEVVELLSNVQARYVLRERSSSTSSFQNWKACLDECDTTYVMFFHDDDQMLPDLVETFWQYESQMKDFLALGFNARVERYGSVVGPSFTARERLIGPLSAKDLLGRYFFKFSEGIAPYPGYIYKTAALKEVTLDPCAGKYKDVCLLVELALIGKIYWINRQVFVYRLHGDNDGLHESRLDRNLFLKFLKAKTSHHDLGSRLADYRYFLYQKRYREHGLKNRRFLKPVRKFLAIYQVLRLTRLEYYKNLVRKLSSKNE